MLDRAHNGRKIFVRCGNGRLTSRRQTPFAFGEEAMNEVVAVAFRVSVAESKGVPSRA